MSTNDSKPRTLGDRLPNIVLAVLLVAGVFHYFQGSDTASSKAELDELRARLALAESDQEVSGAGARTMSPFSQVPQPDLVQSQGLETEKPKSAAEIAAERDRQLKELEAQFARDVIDPAGATVVGALEQGLDNEALMMAGLKPDQFDVDCRRSSCRIAGTFAKRGDAEDWGLFFLTSAGAGLLANTRMVLVPTPNGSTEVRIFSSRTKS